MKKSDVIDRALIEATGKDKSSHDDNTERTSDNVRGHSKKEDTIDQNAGYELAKPGENQSRSWARILDDLATKVLLDLSNALANCAEHLDSSLKKWGLAILQILPSKLRLRLIELNDTFKEGRDRAIGLTSQRKYREFQAERGDVPGWVLVVLMTTGLVTALWAIAAPRLSAILKNSLDSMNNIR